MDGIKRSRRLAAPKRRMTLSARSADVNLPATFSTRGGRFMSVSNALVTRQHEANQVAEVSAAAAAPAVEPKMTMSRLMERRPVAIISHVASTGLSLFLAGGIAGALAKSCTAPLDRVRAIFPARNKTSRGRPRTTLGSHDTIINCPVPSNRFFSVLDACPAGVGREESLPAPFVEFSSTSAVLNARF